MAKRKNAPDKPIEDFFVEDRGNSGIYDNSTVFCNTPEAGQLASAHDNRPLLDRLPEIHGELASVLTELLGEDGWKCEDLVDVFNVYIHRVKHNDLDKIPYELVLDATAAMEYIAAVKKCILAGNAALAATWSFQLGRLIEKCGVRKHHERNAMTGKKIQASVRSAVGERSAKSQERKKWVRQEYATSLAQKPNDAARARRLVRDAYQIQFPDESVALSTIQTYVARRRNRSPK